jgi:hypothetical protein
MAPLEEEGCAFSKEGELVGGHNALPPTYTDRYRPQALDHGAFRKLINTDVRYVQFSRLQYLLYSWAISILI